MEIHDRFRRMVAAGVQLRAAGGRLDVHSPQPLTDEQRLWIKENKRALLELVQAPADARREQVLRMLQDNPEITRVVVADGDLDPVVVTLAVRNVGTCELTIPADRWDPLQFLELLAEHGGQA